jgi:hypothetical protein
VIPRWTPQLYISINTISLTLRLSLIPLKALKKMSFQVSAIAAQSVNSMPETNRRSANYHPSIWGDHFLTYASDFLVKIYASQSMCGSADCGPTCTIKLEIKFLF